MRPRQTFVNAPRQSGYVPKARYKTPTEKTSLKMHVIESKGEATHSFIFLHGYDCSGKENAEHLLSWSHANITTYPGLRVVCPDAPLLKTSAIGYGDKVVHSWYDFEDGNCTSPDDKPDLLTLQTSCTEIHKIIKAVAAIVGFSKVIVGGCSQGCCLLSPSPSPRAS